MSQLPNTPTSPVNTPQVGDWLSLEAPLLACLRSALAGLTPAVKVLSAADLAQVSEGTAPSPAVHLIYAGYTPLEDQGTAVLLQHKWIVAVAVRNVAALASGQAARADTGPLLARVVRAVLTASIEGARGRVQLLTPPPPRYGAGWRMEPVAFGLQTVFNKTQP